MISPTTWSDLLWGSRAKRIYLIFAAAILLFTCLGHREIWTQEHRWSDIVTGMFYRHDFLHPYLNESDYYDKPLLSYWLIAGFSFITGSVSTWALRLPSAFAGLLAIWSIYRIGVHFQDKRLGLLSGWMLLTTFYFIFWAKTSSADMLNLGGTLFAVSWYFDKREQPSFINYAIFFLIVALTSLCKGLIGAVVPVLVILPDLIMKQEWKKHLRLSLFLALIPAAIIYILPFWASSYFGGAGYGENGLYLVFRENVLRYFQPFDHKGPIYTYFIFLPVYLIPWVFFFIPALFSLKSRWSMLSDGSKWMCWSVFILFVFLTLSGSRRNYYVLPIVPFAILMTADWILQTSTRIKYAGITAVLSFALLFLSFDVVQPLYYSHGGLRSFAQQLQQRTSTSHIKWQYVMLDPESKVRFYLGLAPDVKNYPAVNTKREEQTPGFLKQVWPMVTDKKSDVIFVSRKAYESQLKLLLPDYEVIEAPDTLGERIFHIHNQNAPVAFIPKF